jgi:hypothetical protein
MASTKSIPLKDAPRAFASQRLRSLWSHAQQAPTVSRRSKVEPEAAKKLTSENPGEAFKLMAEGFGEMIEDLRVRSAPELAMRASLLRKLREEKLEAWGVESSPARKRELEMLPSHFFMDAKINWNGNKVTNFGVTYSAVTVRRRSTGTPKALSTSANAPPEVPAKPAQQEPIEGQRRKPGPKSVRGEVVATYSELLQKGILKETMTVAEIHQKIYPALKKIFPNERGLAYSSIARHLRAHISGRPKFSS